MFRAVWAIARKSTTGGSRLKTEMSKASLATALFFFLCFMSTLVSYVVYSDSFFQSEPENNYVMLVNSPESFDSYLESKFEKIPDYFETYFRHETSGTYYDFVKYQNMLSRDQIALIIVFPGNFNDQIASLANDSRPEILTYYDPGNENSKGYHETFTKNFFSEYGDELQARYGRTAVSSDIFAIQELEITGTDTRADSALFAIHHMILPLLLFIAVMYSCMETGMACVAGEKERGTFAAILLSPVRRIEIVLGNALGIIIRTMAIAGGILLILLSLIFAAFGYFSIVQVVSLLLLTLSLTVVMAALVLMISIMNRTILAAQTGFLPIFFLMLIICITSMQKQDAPSILYYLLPFYGHYYGIAAVMDGTYSIGLLVSLLAICLAITAALFLAAERLLHVERFTLYADSGKDLARERRQRLWERRIREKYAASPQNRVYGYEPKRMRSGTWLILYHLLMPVSVLSFFQTPALIYPMIDYLRSGRANTFFEKISTSASDVSGMANLIMRFLADLMQTKEFIFSMSLGYILLIAVYVFIITRIEKQPLSSSGLVLKGAGGVRKALRSYGIGLLVGLAMMSLAVFAMLLSGNLNITGIGIDPSQVLLFVAYIAMWIPQGASEELMFRGYMLPRISRRFGRAFAVFFTSASFALLHGANAGVTPLAVINLVLIAWFFAELSLFAGNIWTVSAAHSVWNFAQGNLFGLRVSGTQNTASLIHTVYSDNAMPLLTGGDFGPEGGLIVTGVTVLCLLILFALRHKLKNENRKV